MPSFKNKSEDDDKISEQEVSELLEKSRLGLRRAKELRIKARKTVALSAARVLLINESPDSDRLDAN